MALKPEVDQVVDIKLRTKLDNRWICGVWMPGLYYANDWFREIDKDAYFKKYLVALELILARPAVFVNAALLKIDGDTVASFAVLEETTYGSVLHWAYTRPDWRKRGLIKELLPPNIYAVTHLTKTGRAIKPKEWKFDPFL